MAPADRMERSLVLLLRVVAGMSMAAIVPAVMPLAWMDAVHRALGMGPLPRGPVVEYLARTLSAFYAFHGALLWIFSGDVRRYALPLKFSFGAGFAFGAWVLVVDARAGLPASWTFMEGPFVMAFSAAALLLLFRVRTEAAPRP